MKPIPKGSVAIAEWDQACDASAEAWLFHRHAWTEIEARYFVRSDLSFALADRDSIVAVCPLYLSEAANGTGGEVLLHSGFHRQTGLAIQSGISPIDAAKARGAAMTRVFGLAEAHDADRVQLNVHNLAPVSLGSERPEIPFWVEQHGFELGLSLSSQGVTPAPNMATCNSDQIVDLSPPEDELFGRIEDRNAVRKAKSLGVGFEEGSGNASVERHYDVARRSAERTGESLAPLDYYRDVWRAFSPSARCAILFATHNGAVVASNMLLIDKRAASFLSGVSLPEALPMRPNDFLHWSSIVWAKRRGLGYYRFGPWFPSVDPSWPIAKVSHFKKKFGGRPYTIIQGSWFRHPEKYRAAGRGLLDELCKPRKRDPGKRA